LTGGFTTIILEDAWEILFGSRLRGVMGPGREKVGK